MRSLRFLLVTAASAALIASPGEAQVAPAPGQRVVLVTGSTSGLGRDVALRLAADGWHVIVHGRDVERGQEVLDQIRADGQGSARFYRADFADFAQVRALGEAILADYERLDVLVNNAGFGSAPNERWVSEDGHEFRFQVNYLSPFLLTHLLTPLVEASAPSRIVNVSSLAQSPIDWDDVMIEHEELGPEGVLVTALHPATYMPTGMVRRAGVQPRSTIEEGSDAVLQLVLSDEIEGGQFFAGLTPRRAHDQVYDREHRERLKALSERLTGIR